MWKGVVLSLFLTLTFFHFCFQIVNLSPFVRSLSLSLSSDPPLFTYSIIFSHRLSNAMKLSTVTLFFAALPFALAVPMGHSNALAGRGELDSDTYYQPFKPVKGKEEKCVFLLSLSPSPFLSSADLLVLSNCRKEEIKCILPPSSHKR